MCKYCNGTVWAFPLDNVDGILYLKEKYGKEKLLDLLNKMELIVK